MERKPADGGRQGASREGARGGRREPSGAQDFARATAALAAPGNYWPSGRCGVSSVGIRSGAARGGRGMAAAARGVQTRPAKTRRLRRGPALRAGALSGGDVWRKDRRRSVVLRRGE